MSVAPLMPLLTLLQANASAVSEQAHRNQAMWYLLLAFIALIQFGVLDKRIHYR